MRFWKIHFGALIQKSLFILLALAVFLTWKSFQNMRDTNWIEHGVFSRGTVTFPVRNCRGIDTNKAGSVNTAKYMFFNRSANVYKRVLILSRKALVLRGLLHLLEGHRIEYDIHHLEGEKRDVLPSLTEKDAGKYSTVIFTSYSIYFGMSLWNRRLLDNYCRSFGVGMILFNRAEPSTLKNTELFPFKVHTSVRQFKSYHLSSNATILRLLKGNVLDSEGKHDTKKWSIFIPERNTDFKRSFEVIAKCSFINATFESKIKIYGNPVEFPVVVHDLGKRDRIHKIYFGAGLSFWPHKLLFLDALRFVSRQKLSRTLVRWIQVDVDDIFVGRTGIRMKTEDVKAMIIAQHDLQKVVPGFKFNLGFSGKFYQHGNKEENEGDQEIIENANEFRWFDHTWSHKQPHQVNNLQDMKDLIILNMQFAKKYNIPVDTSYSVAPHHSGVYPVCDILYEAWKATAGVQVTSTEEYPHLRPPWRRKGFIHHGVMVLPRQTCGLFTHNLFLDEYPGGKEVLLNSIYGGDLFETIVNNPISIFMTHLSNYGNDRLALYTFTNVIKFIQCWTNLRLMSLPPLELGKKYFELFPGEVEPVWNKPCKDPRHKEIWPSWRPCNRLPSFLVVGPQKTGTTALHMFLSVHPEVLKNKENEKSYEETQFFASSNYFKGVDWYMNNFPDIPANSSKLLFEKTANYFDSMKAPLRVQALLPEAKIIVILNDPVRRAYSWYQHMRAHGDKIALKVEFYDLLNMGMNVSGPLKNLKTRCLRPGLYAEHLERWMMHFPINQILTVDGDQLKSDPVQVMDQVQSFIGVKKKIDYGTILKYNERKGFFCLASRSHHGHSCLGSSKGRKYPPLAQKAEKYLNDYYREPNRRLAELLHKIRRPVPPWLRTAAAIQ
ncbi:bifunctional heparan sulfate N-deacetylase/N-sulfotransferase 4-like [Dendronephthya gigantea]|uniref:bifunctional heparan sulfate N-deacetylase/N-sulfotransferase 4-like n=1 Tax=Dendronephthya gigantea TaxID=151771 RepID=UPI00106BEF00|nr:bifunctional heparan sulfate N-deacetylase/N-sulfotransferase 4-like [Dendronephthya gigantea]